MTSNIKDESIILYNGVQGEKHNCLILSVKPKRKNRKLIREELQHKAVNKVEYCMMTPKALEILDRYLDVLYSALDENTIEDYKPSVIDDSLNVVDDKLRQATIKKTID